MPARDQVINFGAGPAALPTSVLEQASKDLLNYQNIGMSLAEISHRSKHANEILANANAHLRELLSVPSTHEIIWQQGGGTAQFSAVIYNLVAAYIQRGGSIDDMMLDYIVTGGWSLKAYGEALRLGIGKVNLVVDARNHNNGKFGVIPPESEWNLTPKQNCPFVYYCDNETVDGVEFPGCLQTVDPSVPVVCDMSSNILSRKVDISRFAVIFVSFPHPSLESRLMICLGWSTKECRHHRHFDINCCKDCFGKC
jgi:phosphoserine aminotransferase